MLAKNWLDEQTSNTFGHQRLAEGHTNDGSIDPAIVSIYVPNCSSDFVYTLSYSVSTVSATLTCVLYAIVCADC